MMKSMEEILKELMNVRCVSMHNSTMRCFGKKCDGQCAQFQATLFKLENVETKEIKMVDCGTIHTK